MVGFIEPVGTQFQSARLDLTGTTTKTTKMTTPRHWRQRRRPSVRIWLMPCRPTRVHLGVVISIPFSRLDVLLRRTVLTQRPPYEWGRAGPGIISTPTPKKTTIRTKAN